MRFKTTVILFVIAAAVATYFFVVEQPRHTRDIQRQEREQRLTSVAPDDVHTVEIRRPDVVIRFRRENDHWVMSEPVTDRAEDASVNMLVYSATDAVIANRFPADPSDLAQYGLDEPAATVSFAQEGGDLILVVHIGDLTLRKTHCYALIEGTHDVLLLPAGIHRYALRDLVEFRDERVLDVPVEDVVRVRITTEKRTHTWEKDDRVGWHTVHDGDTIPGDKKAVEDVIRRLRGLRAKDILSGDGQYITTTAGTVSLLMRSDPTEWTIVFGPKGEGGCYAKTTDNDRVVLVEPTILGVFDKTIEDLRDRRLLNLGDENIARVTLETRETTLTIVKTDAGWSYTNPAYGAVDKAAAGLLLARIRNLPFDRSIEERLSTRDGFGFDKPELRLTTFDSEDRIIDRLVVGNPIGENRLRYVTSLSTNMLAGIEADVVAGIESDFQNLGAD